jgi:hypothetical protein
MVRIMVRWAGGLIATMPREPSRMLGVGWSLSSEGGSRRLTSCLDQPAIGPADHGDLQQYMTRSPSPDQGGGENGGELGVQSQILSLPDTMK